jgi:hypothetical protein
MLYIVCELYMTSQHLIILLISGNSLSLAWLAYCSNILNIPVSIPVIAINIVTDLIKALLGNISVNIFQRATLEAMSQ